MKNSQIKRNATISNFTCTFRVNGKHEPMLKYFESIVYPAFKDKNLFYKPSSSVNKYHIADIRLVELDNGVLALTGKHIKRTILDISEDYDINHGFHGIEKKEPSAPYSTFIILLNNHRVIYYKNKKGAPSLTSFQSTCRVILKKYNVIKRKELIDELKNNDNIYSGVKFNYITHFRTKVTDVIYPDFELNIIPIESKELVSKKFEDILKITKVEFRFYPTNNEPINFNNFFEKSFNILEETKSNSMTQTLNSPRDKDVIRTALETSSGKTYYSVHAKDSSSQDIKITPDSVSENISISLDDNQDVESKTQHVYNQLQDNEALTEISEQNSSLYNILKSKLLSLL